MTYLKPFLEAEDPGAFIRAAEAFWLDTGVNVLFDITAGEDRDTNRAWPLVHLAVPKLGARIAYDPESAAVYAPVYREAMGDCMKAIGYPVDSAVLAEAWRLQTLYHPDRELFNEYNSARFSRSRSPETGDAYPSRDADIARIRELHPDPHAAMPENLSSGEAAVWRDLVSTGMIDHTAVALDTLKDAPLAGRLSGMLSAAGFACDRVIILPADLEPLKAESLTGENLEAWKVNAVLVISEKLDYVPSAAEEAVRRMQRAAECALWGNDTAPESQAPAEDDGALQSRALSLLPMEYALLWAEEKYDPAIGVKALEMFEKLRAAYIRRIQVNPWLGEAERKTCVRKLESMEPVIGLPTEENYVFADILPRSAGGTLLSCRVAFSRRELKKNLRLVNEKGYNRKAFDQELFYSGRSMDMRNANAGGNMGYNSVIIPAWFLMYAVDPAADEGRLWGTLGAFIAHEMSHNFDQNGAKHDENGAFRNWWSGETYEKLYRIRDRFEAHFERAEIIRGLSRPFHGEMGECFSDFSGIQLVMDLIGDDPDTRRAALEAWAAFPGFLSVLSRAQLEQMIEFDMFTSHPTGAQRVNGVLSALDCFFDLYDVKEGDPMYTAPEDRLNLW